LTADVEGTVLSNPVNAKTGSVVERGGATWAIGSGWSAMLSGSSGSLRSSENLYTLTARIGYNFSDLRREEGSPLDEPAPLPPPGPVLAASSSWQRCGPRRPRGDPDRPQPRPSQEAGLDCLTCHEPIFDVTELDSPALPQREECLECHKKDKEDGKWRDVPHPRGQAGHYVRKPPYLIMNHAKHLEKMTSARCVTSPFRRGTSSEKPVPPMEDLPRLSCRTTS
jgi:hypothetical protein